MAKPNMLTSIAAEVSQLDNVYAVDGETEEMNRAFLRYTREARNDETPEEFVRREFTGNSVIREAARHMNWSERKLAISGRARDIATKQAQTEMAEATRRLMPVINDVTDILKTRLNELKRANVSVIDPAFEVLFHQVERTARTLAGLQTSLAKQQTINIVNSAVASTPNGQDSPRFAGWGDVVDHQR